MTETEVECVTKARDRRYQLIQDDKEAKPADNMIKIDPETMTPLEMEQARAANAEERQRQNTLSKDNDIEATIILSLKQKSVTDLVLLAHEENTKAKRIVIPTEQGTDVKVIISGLARIYASQYLAGIKTPLQEEPAKA